MEWSRRGTQSGGSDDIGGKEVTLTYQEFINILALLLSKNTSKKLRKMTASGSGDSVTMLDGMLTALAAYVDKAGDGRISLLEIVSAMRNAEMKRWRKQVLKRIASEFFHNRYRLMRAFRCFEFEDSNGVIGEEGFKAGLRAINLVLNKKALNDTQIDLLYEALDTDGTGYIFYDQFLDFFRVYDVEKIERKKQQKMEAKLLALQKEEGGSDGKIEEEDAPPDEEDPAVPAGGAVDGSDRERGKKGKLGPWKRVERWIAPPGVSSPTSRLFEKGSQDGIEGKSRKSEDATEARGEDIREADWSERIVAAIVSPPRKRLLAREKSLE